MTFGGLKKARTEYISHGAKCMLWNTRSAMSKLPVIIQTFADSGADFLIATETWHPRSIPGKLDTFTASIINFAAAEGISEITVHSKARSSGKRGGGIALVSKPAFTFSYFNLDIAEPSSFEYLSVKCKCESPFILLAVYRIPSVTFSVFLQEFESLLSCLNFAALPSVLCGDFNVRINLPDQYQTVSFCNLLQEYNYSILSSDLPTHCSGNILDFFITSVAMTTRCVAGSVDSSIPISDHFPVFFHLELAVRAKPTSLSTHEYRAYKCIDEAAFCSDLVDTLVPLEDSSGLHFRDLLNLFNSSLSSLLDKHAPFKGGYQPRKDRPVWLDGEYNKARALRKRLQKLPDKSRYNAQNRYCSRLAREKWETYNNSLIEKLSGGNQKQFYKVLNKLVGKDVRRQSLPSHQDPKILANCFNNFFVDKVHKIRESLPAPTPSADFPHTGQPLGPELATFTPTNEAELMEIIAEHGVKTNVDDPLPDFLYMKHIDVLLPHLVKLVNLSLSSASCDGIKDAYVVPILKSLNLDQDVLRNYRPVSLLSFVSKLTERVVHRRISDHLQQNNLMNPSQYGYKKHHSCETLLLKLVDDILIAVDNNSGVIVLLIDLSAAFDTVDHSVLLSILQNKFRIKNTALEWIRSFLSGRSQKVKIGHSISEPLLITFGVPQGSILGPLLFNMYCASIDNAFLSAGFNSMGYADDNFGLRLFPAFAAPSTLLEAIPDCLKAVKLWTDRHFLKLNSDKTQVMVFSDTKFRQQYTFNTFRNDDGDMLPVSHSAKVLGVTLDSYLCFNEHISNTVSSVNFALRNIRLVRKCISTEAAETLIHSLITNKLDQCNILLMGISDYNVSKLQKLQNNALRTVLNLPSRSHNISSQLRDKHWLPIRSRIIFKFLVTVFKCLNNMAPQQLVNKLCLECPVNMILSSNNFRPKSSFGRRCFTYLAPRYWNALPRAIRVAESISEFKSELKFYLFDNTNEFLHKVDPYTTFSFSQPGTTSTYTNERFAYQSDYL